MLLKYLFCCCGVLSFYPDSQLHVIKITKSTRYIYVELHRSTVCWSSTCLPRNTMFAYCIEALRWYCGTPAGLLIFSLRIFTIIVCLNNMFLFIYLLFSVDLVTILACGTLATVTVVCVM